MGGRRARWESEEKWGLKEWRHERAAQKRNVLRLCSVIVAICAISCQDRHYLHHHFVIIAIFHQIRDQGRGRHRDSEDRGSPLPLQLLWGRWLQCEDISVIDSYVIICRKVWSYRSSFQWSSHWHPIIQMDIFWPRVYFLPIKSLFTILKVVTMDGNEVGKITKQWSGIARWNILNSKEFLFIT